MLDSARPWAVWVCRLASNSTFWLAHPRGRCTRVASPSTDTASPERAISTSHWRRSSRLVMKVPSGWQYPSEAVAHLGLGDPDHAASTAVRQPVQQHGGDGVQAHLQRQRRGAALPGRGGVRWARRLASQASTLAGSDERGQEDKGNQTSTVGCQFGERKRNGVSSRALDRMATASAAGCHPT
jgi:hypothetical protein